MEGDKLQPDHIVDDLTYGVEGPKLAGKSPIAQAVGELRGDGL